MIDPLTIIDAKVPTIHLIYGRGTGPGGSIWGMGFKNYGAPIFGQAIMPILPQKSGHVISYRKMVILIFKC